MRVIAGELRGRTLRAVRGLKVRPSADRVKESLFNILAPRIADIRFLDLFAGTGSIGIEALSRGVAEVVFVEQDRDALRCLKRNLEVCRLELGFEVIPQPVSRALREMDAEGRVFNMVFLDPPYQADLYASTLDLLGAGDLVAADGWVIAEHDRRLELANEYGKLCRFRTRLIGDTALSFYRGGAEEEDG
jgi:16S rRNA (guanine966-N2)-methyltransferase